MRIKDNFSKAYDIDKDTGCWNWNRSLLQNGYGQVWDGERRVTAHSLSYRIYVGDIVDNNVVDHICRNRKCVNPKHLRQITSAKNVLIGEGVTALNARKTHCVNGHEFTEKNTYIVKKRNNGRYCKQCRYQHHLNFKKRKLLV